MLNKRVLIAPAALLLCATPAFAGVATNVSVQDALTGRVRVTVAAEGGGTILDFSQTGEKIEKITIDDPSKVLTDHCLITKSCNGRPEPMVRLFRANIPQKDIPSVKTTQLTVLTTDSSGQWNSYIFSVTPSVKPSVYTKYVIGGRTHKTHTLDFASAALGARQAQEHNLLVDPALKGRVKTFLRLTQAGTSEKVAAKKAGISMSLVTKLESLGQERVAQGGGTLPVADASANAPTEPLPKPKHHHTRKREIVHEKPHSQTISQNTPAPKPEPIAPAPAAQAQSKSEAVAPTIAQTTPEAKLKSDLKSDAEDKEIPYSKPETPFQDKPKSKAEAPAIAFSEPAPAIAQDKPEITPQSQSALKPKHVRVKPKAKTVATVRLLPKPQHEYQPKETQVQANALVKGLVIARREKKVSAAIASSVQDVIYLLRKGQPISKAAQNARVPMKTLDQLLAMAGG